MRKGHVFILFTLLLSGLFSCKKIVEKKQTDALIAAMTSGEWQVTRFTEVTSDITRQFYGYRFQFMENGTVWGNHDHESVKGSWRGDLSNLTITSHFPDASNPLKKLNGTWRITSSRMTLVQAEMTTVSGKYLLTLERAG